jgi:hypothetical protein
VRVARVVQLLCVDLLGRVDVLVHERTQAPLELGAALARLEVHRLSFGLMADRVYGTDRCISTSSLLVQMLRERR